MTTDTVSVDRADLQAIIDWFNGGEPAWKAMENITSAIRQPASPLGSQPENHICTKCGEKGWTANCDQCIPY